MTDTGTSRTTFDNARRTALATTLVVTTEASGIDRYARELGTRLDVATVEVSRYAAVDPRSLTPRPGTRLVHLPNQHFGRFVPTDGRHVIVTVHDLVRLCFPFEPESTEAIRRLEADAEGLRRAGHLVCVSHDTARDVTERLGVSPEKITVIPNGHDPRVFRPDAPDATPMPPLPARYFLYVGSERPRKNLGGLLRALARVDADPVCAGVPLVKVGPAGRSTRFRDALLTEAERLGIRESIVFLEGLSDVELAAVYRGAIALVVPSFHEGFGLPLLEAMACGCPVIASNVAALPEIAGHAARLVDPHEPDSIAAAMRDLATNVPARRDLSSRGLERARPLTWDRTAARTADVYREQIDRLASASSR